MFAKNINPIFLGVFIRKYIFQASLVIYKILFYPLERNKLLLLHTSNMDWKVIWLFTRLHRNHSYANLFQI